MTFMKTHHAYTSYGLYLIGVYYIKLCPAKLPNTISHVNTTIGYIVQYSNIKDGVEAACIRLNICHRYVLRIY